MPIKITGIEGGHKNGNDMPLYIVRYEEILIGSHNVYVNKAGRLECSACWGMCDHIKAVARYMQGEDISDSSGSTTSDETEAERSDEEDSQPY